jgi:hypothetical protein
MRASELLLNVHLESTSRKTIKLPGASLPKTFDDLLAKTELDEEENAIAYRYAPRPPRRRV